MLRLTIGKHPNVGGDAGVVEHVQRQGDNGFEPIVLDDPTANVAFTLSRVPREQRRAVMYFRNAATELGLMLHLREHVGQEQHLAVAGSRDERIFCLSCMLNHETRVFYSVLPTHSFEVALPTLAVRWVRQHEVEFT